MDNVKLIRDFVLGDGSIYRSGNDCIFSISHSREQLEWLLWKKKQLDNYGYIMNFWEDNSEKGAGRLRSYPDYNFKKLWRDWYFFSNNKYQKHHQNLINSFPIDEDTIAILFLDNGSRAIKKDCKCYRTRTRILIEPYIEKFRISVGDREQQPVIDMLKQFKVDARKSREFTGNGEVLIGTTASKEIIQDIVSRFCKKNAINIFEYKYNYPLAMSRVQRLSESESF